MATRKAGEEPEKSYSKSKVQAQVIETPETNLKSEAVAGERKFLCKVYRLNEEKENANFPISVGLIGKSRVKRVFDPGDEVVLFDYHIEILRNAVSENEIEIPSESAVYESKDPTRQAENNFPGYRARVNPEDGLLTLIKHIPKYSVEVIEALN